MFNRILANSRYLILLPVILSLVGAIAVLVYSSVATFSSVIAFFQSNDYSAQGLKDVAVAALTLIDLILLGTVLYIVALGLYELFIDPHLPTPEWLHIESLDSLKEKLIGTITVLLLVSFLAAVTDWKTGADIAFYSIAIGAVIAAVALLLWVQGTTKDRGEK